MSIPTKALSKTKLSITKPRVFLGDLLTAHPRLGSVARVATAEPRCFPVLQPPNAWLLRHGRNFDHETEILWCVYFPIQVEVIESMCCRFVQRQVVNRTTTNHWFCHQDHRISNQVLCGTAWVKSRWQKHEDRWLKKLQLQQETLQVEPMLGTGWFWTWICLWQVAPFATLSRVLPTYQLWLWVDGFHGSVGGCPSWTVQILTHGLQPLAFPVVQRQPVAAEGELDCPVSCGGLNRLSRFRHCLVLVK